ncbi:C40 family peptidase [Nocardioides sambongensis]|uniref:C40 family peptidase n=1 Tax=Nocardioides sambongensis TaxID=2589074 RepID=UPI00112E5959|nr:C40 family peptidase [Nocardioides sambongensis]
MQQAQVPATGPRRPARRRPLALVLGSLALAATTAVPVAQAAPGADPGPTRQDVREARQDQQQASDDVASVKEALATANANAENAAVAAAKAAEAYNGARWRAQVARRDLRTAEAASRRADNRLAEQRETYRRTLVGTLGSDIDLTALTAVFDADGVSSLLADATAIDTVQGALQTQHDDFTAAAEDAEDAETAADEAATEATDAATAARVARDEASSAAAAAADAATSTAARQDRLVRRLARLQGVTVALVEQRQERAEERARAEQDESRPSPDQDVPTAPEPDQATPQPEPQPSDDPTNEPEPEPEPGGGDTPPAAGGASAAIAFARAQLGEPYRWAAAGPSAWDCSGLTMGAWQAGGKSLPHYSVAQYDASTPITASQLQPGDLVFWSDGSPSSIYHVALYAGNGMIIHAPRTGRPVTEESMYYWRTPDHYARP